MPAVVNLDQRASRRRGLEPTRALLQRLQSDRALKTAIPFAQSSGDEIQGVLDSSEDVVRVLLHATRLGPCWVGIGLGRVQLEAGSVHQSTGEAFFLAREGLTQAKKRAWGVAVRSSGAWAPEYEQALALWTAILKRRSEAGWEVVERADAGVSTQEIASELGISDRAVTKRLRVADWRLDRVGRELATQLGEHAMTAATTP